MLYIRIGIHETSTKTLITNIWERRMILVENQEM
jgi:hypothetical protein